MGNASIKFWFCKRYKSEYLTVLEISGRPVVRDDQKVYRATNL